ncbi:tRNA pseudouridine(55) synthase TruB [Blattabacterium cuenoti]|uniref:tRNA pseudouridine(55) synthase TruB n=1 Tax=Blattabacterium cuenoti TaxID=1653831 RepID=UPI00163C98B4|nr:tRNA pseudouridine(55) synthase TruB [Blattabacterium cuenoti]
MIKDLFQYQNGKIFLIDKPWGWTSFDVVKKMKISILMNTNSYYYKKKKKINLKIGHAGTLDPLATGLLIILTGEYTKKAYEIQDYKKTYTGIIKLGCETSSFDSETREYNFSSTLHHITPRIIKKTSEKFIGKINQFPPYFSALKKKGKKYYEYARKGKKIISIKPRCVTIYNFHILKIGIPYIKFFIECGRGTYIRSVANDFGKKLKTGAYLLSLRRESIGNFSIKESSNSIFKFFSSKELGFPCYCTK